MAYNQQRGGRFGAVNATVNQGQDSGYDAYQGALRAKTHLIQVYCEDPEEAPRILAENHPHGVPIMAIISEQPSCCYFKINIPNGMYALEQKWGAHQGIMEPGFRCCYCSYKKIAVMLTKNTIRFKCPITNIPTKDDVRVSIDMGINFHLGSQGHDEDDMKKFFYNFGPNRLEELLTEECDEGIRDFLKGIKVQRVRDIKTELTSQLKDALQKKFNPYGVVIEQVNIMNIIIPKDLRFCLMQTTEYDVFLQKQVKQQENRMLVLSNTENKEILRLKRDNIQKLFALQHDKDVEEINLQETEIKAETEQIIKSINAHKVQSAKLIEANSQKQMAELRSKAKATQVLQEAEAFKSKLHQEADNEAEVIRKKAMTRLAVAQDKTKALVIEAVSESGQQGNLQNDRKHKEKMKLNDALETLAKRGHMVVSGQNGQQVLNFFNSTIEQVVNNQEKR